MQLATDQSVANFKALNASNALLLLCSSFFLLSSPPLFSSVHSAVPASRRVAPSRLTPPSLLHCNAGRRRITSPRRSRSSISSGGSISVIEIARLLAEKFGREPTPIEVYTHTKDHDLNTFVDRCAVSVNENYTIARERLVSSQAESKVESTIDEIALYLEGIGGEKKRKVYGIGSQASQFYCGSASHASAGSAGPQSEHSAEEFTALRARVDDQQRQIAELRTHVMRLSGQSGAGTSSSDHAPATDRNVSTS
ncbi:hypothetical protein JCGZ_10963 [Jatropha curcas]|uniref:Uncharacterized protein n=1 Tax=Jatropha curcas TaxID=180498 RepID=A0A067LQ29_JATCU|nr:hypothetical protein JCGZ_10963 [Jatropha curcas]